MRILFFTDRLSLRGGAGQHLLQVMGWAAGKGWEVVAAAGRVDRDVEVAEGVRVVTARGLGSAVASAARLGRLEGLFDGVDVVHVQNVMNPVALEAAMDTGRAVVTVQDHRVLCPGPGRTLPDGRRCRQPMSEETCARCLPDAAYRRRMVALTSARLAALRRARAVVVLSRYMAEELAGVGLGGAHVIPPWVEAGPPRSGAGHTFLLGGRLVAHKAPLDAVRAWEAAGRPLPLEVAGEGPLARRLGAPVRLGWLGRHELRAALRRARALLFPARWQEPFGILGVEALAEGTPVVVADVGGTRDWSGEGCVRVPAGDVAAMAEAIRYLSARPQRAVELGELGRRRVRRLFGRDRIVARLEALYRAISS